MEAYYWLIAMAVLLAIEIATVSLLTIWFAGGSLVAFAASLVGANFAVQLALFFLVSIVMLIFTRPWAMKYFNNNRKKTNYESIIGTEGRVIQDVDNFESKGRIVVNGQEWTARAVDGKAIPMDSKVVIEAIEGVKAMVRRL